MTVKKFDVMKHALVPRHDVLSEKDAMDVLHKYNVTIEQLPKIYASDPVARAVRARPGQVIKIKRKSPTAGVALAYRVVVEG
ncbi:MAG: DNA-directed RNA polymerase subunit H [Methanobacteriota archaeon]